MRPSRLARTTAFRLSLLFAALFLACVVVLFVVIDWYALGSLQAELRTTISARMAAILGERAGPGAAGLAQGVVDAIEQDPGVAVLLQDAQGRRLAGNLPPRTPQSGWIGLHRPPGAGSPHVRHPVIASGVRLPDGGYLLLGLDAFALEQMRELVGRAFLVGGTLTLLLAMAAGFVVSRGVLRRVAAVGSAGRTIMRGDLTRRLPSRGTGDELDQLVDGFNAMLGRIGTLMETMQQVTSDIAHDLRTPLTRLRMRLEEVRRRPRSVAEYEAAIDRTVADSDAILQTFAALLRVAQIEATTDGPPLEYLEAATLIASVVEIYQPLADECGDTLVGDAGAFRMRGDRELLIQMLGNLIENSCRHAPLGTRIATGARREAAAVLLWVEDDGGGIPEEERGKVLRPFYRRDASRSTAGNGLGLALVAAIAARHGGTLELRDAGPGLRVEVRLPVG